ncbi:MAG: YegP family protein [Anaerolineales bacterium]|nr:YegP family protein [Anaerolineales bacterium]
MAIPNPKFQIFCGKDDQYYFRLLAENGDIVLASEGYTAKANCENGIRSVKENAVNQARFENRMTQNGRPYFFLKAANHEVIGISETYSSEYSRDIGIASVMANAPIAPVEDLA